ncbi:hypothetical protein LCGC14_1330200 [marine sediment metagenome]|uniref:Uncharacterized protein n=1 Tax=marine sediment metagenome TaxID=412755 RepID=A0A0F9L2S3_9ZZZZ
MNVWIKLTRKRVRCRYCEQLIEVGEFQVVCSYFMKLKHSDKTWTKVMHFHAKDPYCWIDSGILEVGMRPYAENRGRRPDALSDTDKLCRQQILRRRASVMQRIGCEMIGGGRPEKLVHLTQLLEKQVVEIERYGGVPKSWQ